MVGEIYLAKIYFTDLSDYKIRPVLLADVTLILLSLPLLLPLLIVVALLVRVKLGSPVLFKQVRPYPKGHKGLAGKPFTMSGHCFFIANCYNVYNITATPIEEAQPWRFFIASKKLLDA